MEVLMQNFGIEPTALTSPQYVVMAPVASFEEENTEDTEKETPTEENSEETSNGSEYSITFVLDGRSNAFTSEEFDYIKGEIKKFSDEVLSYKPNTTIRTVTQEASFFDSLVITDEISKIVNSSKSTTKNFIFEIYNQTDAVFEQNIAGELCTNANNAKVNISIISPFKKALSGFQQELSKNTGGLAINELNDFNFEKIYNHVYGKPLAEQEFKAVLITGLQPVKLNGRLNAFNGIDTDSDTLSDWDEIDVNHWIEMGLIRYDNDEEIVLPTLAQCMALTEKPYVETGLEHYLDGYMDFIKDMRVLPIVSDPTNPDTDRDGYDDEQDLAPMTPFVNPIILLHGRIDDTNNAFGLPTNVCPHKEENKNGNINLNDDDFEYYTDVETHIIDIKNIKSEKLGYYLTLYNYKANKNLFAFSYPNWDFAQNNAPKLAGYIHNLKRCVKGEIDVPNEFLAKECDIFATKDDLKNDRARFILIGHSNGGLVSRYYIENHCFDVSDGGEVKKCLKGNECINCNTNGSANIDKLITIDTPHYGSTMAYASTIAMQMGYTFGKALPLDVELRPNSSLFTGQKLDTNSTNALVTAGTLITSTHNLLTSNDLTDRLKFIQENQSFKLNRNSNVDTQYYAIGSAIAFLEGVPLADMVYNCEFNVDPSSIENFKNSLNDA